MRKDFEKKLISKNILKRLYEEYNPQVNSNKFVTEAEKIFPKLNCGLTSVYLKNLLGGKIVQGKYKRHNHTFLLLQGNIIDITADQYDGPKIYVGKLKSPWRLS